MRRIVVTSTGLWLAAASAGPIFAAANLATQYVAAIPATIEVEPGAVLGVVPLILAVVAIGTILAFLPVLLGAMLMMEASERFEWAREPEAWLAAGAVAGWGIARLFGAADPGMTFVLVATSAACAGICRLNMRVE